MAQANMYTDSLQNTQCHLIKLTEFYLSTESWVHLIGDITSSDLMIATQIHGYPHCPGSYIII